MLQQTRSVRDRHRLCTILINREAGMINTKSFSDTGAQVNLRRTGVEVELLNSASGFVVHRWHPHWLHSSPMGCLLVSGLVHRAVVFGQAALLRQS